MNVIFLDIDGVMLSYHSIRLGMLLPFWKEPYLSWTALRALRYLARKSQGQVVIISSWRGCGPPYEAIKAALARNGTPVWGETPWLEDGAQDRSDEIFAWLREHPTCHYVVLDDNDRFQNRISVRSHWIPVNAMVGLTMKNARQALRYFQR